ncbi:MAG TPA: hypothetical protein DCL43_09755 [Chitinophagaceae bacterium]|nr:hypothetical protein [Chitinophagaceae bacterium]HAN40024.1 hypothetical protein [Chitinophagaceae bacterium]
MQLITSIKHSTITVLLLLPLCYLWYLYPTLPNTIPMHYNLQGEVDRWGHKSEMWFAASILSVVGIGSYFLVYYAAKIDPKKMIGNNPALTGKMAVLLATFMTALNLFIIHSTTQTTLHTPQVLFVGVGLLFTTLGNFLSSIKPNYFIGVRTPWTLENNDVWRRTHRFTARLWFAGGLLASLVTLILPTSVANTAFISIMFLLVVIPIAYSYIIFPKA